MRTGQRWLVLAAEVEAARAEVERWRGQHHERWAAATVRLRAALYALYSPEWERIVAALAAGDRTAVDEALVFLETDPRCFRSGYEKERLCRYLARIELDDRQRQRAQAVAEARMANVDRPSRERRAFGRLANRLAP